MKRTLLLALALTACDRPSPSGPGPSTVQTVPSGPGPVNPTKPGGASTASTQETVPQEMTQGLERVKAGELTGAMASFEKAYGRGYVPARAWIERLKIHAASSPPLAEAGWPKPAVPEKPTYEPAAENEFLKADREAKEKAATDPAAAEKLFAALAEKYAASAESVHNRAVCIALQGKWEEALDIAKACVLDHGARHHLVAGAHLKAGRLEEAMSAADLAVRLEPRAKVAFIRRALIFEKQKKLDEALQDLQAAVGLDPEDIELRQKRVELLELKGDFPACLQDLDVIIAKTNDMKLILRRAKILVASGNPGAALKDFDALLEATPENFELHLERSAARERAGSIDEAVADVTWCIARQASAELYARRGRINAERHQWPPAETDLQKARELNAKCFEAQYWSGYVCKEKREYKKAVDYLEAAAQLKPEVGDIYFHLTQVYGILRQYEKAYDSVCKARKFCGKEQQANIDFLMKAAKSRVQQQLDNATKAAWALLEENGTAKDYLRESADVVSDGAAYQVTFKPSGSKEAAVIRVDKATGKASPK